MIWEAESGPITGDETKVIVGCSLERIPLQPERRYQHSYLIIRPHSEWRTPRTGGILKLKRICWHGRSSQFQRQQKRIQINPPGRFLTDSHRSNFKQLACLFEANKRSCWSKRSVTPDGNLTRINFHSLFCIDVKFLDVSMNQNPYIIYKYLSIHNLSIYSAYVRFQTFS